MINSGIFVTCCFKAFYKMISVLVCSIRPEYLQRLRINIQNTIGVEFELLSWDNRADNFGICQVYNELGKKARFDILCFIHEDVEIKTRDWGKKILTLFSDPDIAGVGLAGTKYKSKSPSGWYTGDNNTDRYFLSHSYANEKVDVSNKQFWPEVNEAEVVCLDGVFISCRRTVWERLRFNQEDYKGFHFYDIDFSLRAGSLGKLLVTSGIQLEHFTQGGDYGEKWVRDAILFHRLWHEKLPMYRGEYASKQFEKMITRLWLDRLKNERISLVSKLDWLRSIGWCWDIRFFYSIFKFIFYQPFGLRKLHHIIKRKQGV